jgi:hypothetical protein
MMNQHRQPGQAKDVAGEFPATDRRCLLGATSLNSIKTLLSFLASPVLCFMIFISSMDIPLSLSDGSACYLRTEIIVIIFVNDDVSHTRNAPTHSVFIF